MVLLEQSKSAEYLMSIMERHDVKAYFLFLQQAYFLFLQHILIK
jgi:hypothetical protein